MPTEQLEALVIKDFSSGDIRKMLGEETTAHPVETETPEPSKEEQIIEPATGTGRETQQVEVEDDLPENVKKRIAKEVERTARYQAEIDKAVSARKEAEKKLADLNGKPGSEPAKQTEPKKDARPTRPDLATFPGNLTEYNAAVAKYEGDFEEWISNQSRESVRKELTEQQGREAAMKAWDAATTKHGEEFPTLMESLKGSVPVKLQEAISTLDNWSDIAVHIAKNEGDRNELVEKFKVSPTAAMVHLGKLEAKLTPAAQVEQSEKPLPRPLKPIAGGPSSSVKPIDLDKAPMSQFTAEISSRLKAYR